MDFGAGADGRAAIATATLRAALVTTGARLEVLTGAGDGAAGWAAALDLAGLAAGALRTGACFGCFGAALAGALFFAACFAAGAFFGTGFARAAFFAAGFLAAAAFLAAGFFFAGAFFAAAFFAAGLAAFLVGAFFAAAFFAGAFFAAGLAAFLAGFPAFFADFLTATCTASFLVPGRNPRTIRRFRATDGAFADKSWMACPELPWSGKARCYTLLALQRQPRKNAPRTVPMP